MNNQRIIPPEHQRRTLKHVDPQGRIALGRRYAFQSFTMVEHIDGRILLSPAEVVEKNQMLTWRLQVQRGETPPPPEPLHMISFERRRTPSKGRP